MLPLCSLDCSKTTSNLRLHCLMLGCWVNQAKLQLTGRSSLPTAYSSSTKRIPSSAFHFSPSSNCRTSDSQYEPVMLMHARAEVRAGNCSSAIPERLTYLHSLGEHYCGFLSTLSMTDRKRLHTPRSIEVWCLCATTKRIYLLQI